MQVPSSVSVRVEGKKLVVQGPQGTLEKTLPVKINAVVNGSSIEFQPESNKLTRRVKAQVGAMEAHFRNMVQGVQKPYEKKLHVVYSHFPVSIEVKGNEVLIKNFLGEKTPRKTRIQGQTKVAVNGQEVVVSGNDKEDVGQTASNLARATRILRRDERVFQDGIYYA